MIHRKFIETVFPIDEMPYSQKKQKFQSIDHNISMDAGVLIGGS